MERNVGEIFEHNGEWYQCTGGTCRNCSFYYDTVCKNITTIGSTDFGNCHCSLRTDHKSVIFEKLEKVGEPYKFQKRIIQAYKLNVKPFILPDMDFIWSYLEGSNTIDIIIKQTKEDMEEKYSELTDIVHEYMDKDMTYKDFKEAINDWVDDYVANKESDKPTLKPFDLQQAKDGKPVCTRDGRKSRIICFDVKAKKPIAALITNDDTEEVHFYYDNGRSDQYQEYRYDLMMLPEKKEGWVNIVRGSDGRPHMGRGIFQSKEEAENAIKAFSDNLIDTVKIIWEG